MRDALASAANGDTINCSVAGTILLTSGELLITNSVHIIGPGLLAVSGNAASRVFHIGSNTVVGIASLAITNGNASGDVSAGGYPADSGGGIFNDHAALTVSNCTVSGNVAATFGGGIFNQGNFEGNATLTIVNSTVSANSANYGGGGIFNNGFSGNAGLEISTSTLNDNSTASGTGGGILNDGINGAANLIIANSTLSGNSAAGPGGGIYEDGLGGSASLRIVNSTLSGNSAGLDAGGIHLFAGSVEIGSTILNAGASGENIAKLNGTIVSLGYNLSSDGGDGWLTDSIDLLNTDPLLDPAGLQDNGGPTRTIALHCGSPAVDQGKNFSGSTTDQRGTGFVRTVDDPAVPNAPRGDGTDIGAFEVPQGVCNPVEQIGGVITLVRGLGLSSGTANSLIAKLEAALSTLGTGNNQVACGDLGAFLNEVNAQKGKKLTAAQADLLIAEATRIRAILACQ